MKTLFLAIILISSSFAQVNFDEFFHDKTLRLDYFHSCDSEKEFFTFDELIEEPFWGGSKKNLIDKFDYGKYKVVVYDKTSELPIYSRTYSTLFGEWQTTEEADRVMKSFSETVVFPYPKKEVRIELLSRDEENRLVKKFTMEINPENYFIIEERKEKYPNFKIHHSGDPSVKVDIVLIPEGYTENEMDKFKQDAKKFSDYLFNSRPFKENKEKFNIWGIEAPSKETGTDIPAENIWKNTLVDSRFYTFDLERYLMTTDNKSLRNVASNAPYDQIYILVNSSKYGGGSIYNHYSVCVSDNLYEEYVFVHEFGHGFAFLADEYYTSDVAYEGFYPMDIEPLEPNLTTLVNFETKWKSLVDEDIPIPTPVKSEYENKVGVYEGGGYMAKGIYRPMQECTMKSIVVDKFCKVCLNSIEEMIEFYTE